MRCLSIFWWKVFIHILLPTLYQWQSLYSFDFRYEIISGFFSKKFAIVFIPGVGDSWAVCHNQDSRQIHLLAQVVYRQGFSKTGFAVKQEFASFMGNKIILGLNYRCLLFRTEDIRNNRCFRRQ